MDKLGFNVHQILRYGYAGALLSLLAYLIAPTYISSIIYTFGTTISIFIALSLGAVVYSLCRGLFVDFFTAPLYEIIHSWLERCWGYDPKNKTGQNCRCTYLKQKYSLKPRTSLIVYRTIRDNYFEDKVAERFHTSHSEIHLLYLTSFLTLLSALLVRLGFSEKKDIAGKAILIYLVVGLLFFISGIISDIYLCRRETAYLKKIDNEKVKETVDKVKA